MFGGPCSMQTQTYKINRNSLSGFLDEINRKGDEQFPVSPSLPTFLAKTIQVNFILKRS